MPPLIVEILGWAGVVFYVLAYFLLSTGLLKASSPVFHLLNMAGAIGLIIDAWAHNDLPNLVVNSIWLTIGFCTLLFRHIRNTPA